jgi:hypothetical protein
VSVCSGETVCPCLQVQKPCVRVSVSVCLSVSGSRFRSVVSCVSVVEPQVSQVQVSVSSVRRTGVRVLRNQAGAGRQWQRRCGLLVEE